MNLTDTQRAALDANLAKAQHLAQDHARILQGCRAILAEPSVDMLADPLAPFRLPNGTVAFDTVCADDISVGDWVQRCHGDPDWHLVTEVECFTGDDGRPWVKVRIDDTANFWVATDVIRRATPPADVVAGQERKAEAGR